MSIELRELTLTFSSLWNSDVDMGFSLEEWQEKVALSETTASDAPSLEGAQADVKQCQEPPCDALVKLTSKDIHDPTSKDAKKDDDEKETSGEDPWTGIAYTVDMETGEFIANGSQEGPDSALREDDPPSALLPQPEFSLEEALHLIGLNENIDLLEPAVANATAAVVKEEEKEKPPKSEKKPKPTEETALTPEDLETASSRLQNELDILANIMRTPEDTVEEKSDQNNNRTEARMPYMRTMSMEQRWQDLASLLSLPEQSHYPHPHSHHPHHSLHHHHHHHHHPGGSPGVPSNPAYHHGPPPQPPEHHKGVLLHNATLPPPIPDVNHMTPYAPMGNGNNMGASGMSSMNMMTNSSEPIGGEAAGPTFKMENPQDMMYYQNNGTGDLAGQNTTDGFLSSILEDDLQLMDMAMNEGVYTMRMIEGASGATGGDSDSAVSSMGSERVPSLTSDTDWMETNSDSGHTPADHYHGDYHQRSAFSKYKWYDYGYSRSGEGSSRPPPVAQKKHQMYGKRMFQEQAGANNPPNQPQQNSPPNFAGNNSIKYDYGSPSTSMSPSSMSPGVSVHSPYPSMPIDMAKVHQPELKYSCSVEFISTQSMAPRSTPAEVAVHNHTYHMLPEQCGAQQKPLTRDKKAQKSEEEQHLTRDERRARAMNIPIPVSEIINLPMDEFNERLSKYDLSENQLSLIRDIRRRGKNKVAAQNCRKRKLDQILSLADEVKQMRERKLQLQVDRDVLLTERLRMKSKFSQLYRHIFQGLRDPEGNRYSPFEWSLQQTADGSVILLPRGNQSMMDPADPMPHTPSTPSSGSLVLPSLPPQPPQPPNP